jgi:PAS domain S-box-containing protein
MKIARKHSSLDSPSDKNLLPYVRERVALMVENARDFAIMVFDTDRKTVLWNPGSELIFGHKPDEIIGKSASIIFTPEDRKNQVPEQEFDTAIKTGRAEDERWHLKKDGSRIFVSGVMMRVEDRSGKLLGFTKIARDVTPLKHTQEMLVEARNKAEAANAAKTEFLQTISHEIRTPLNAIVGLSEILQRSQPLTNKQKEYIDTLYQSADFLHSLVDNLLDIARIEARTVELEKIPFSLIEVIENITKMMANKVREKGIALTLEADCIKGCRFIGDPARVRHIILNLCSNAVKFTDQGEINIHVSSQHTDKPEIEDVCIRVQDSGIGIATDKISTIFQKFAQADSSIKRRYGGTGLGLSITKNLVELMGGTIAVTSDLGKGSVFTVCLPLTGA